MHQVIQISLLLASLSITSNALSPKFFSSKVFLLPAKSICAINFGKDSSSSFESVHLPQSFFYDGVRCKNYFSRNMTTGFVVGNSRRLRDVFDAVQHIGDAVVLKAQLFDRKLRHDRLGGMRRRTGVVLCGERGLHEVLFVYATRNEVVKVRNDHFQVQKGFVYAFADVSSSTTKKDLQGFDENELCLFKGKLSGDSAGDDAEGGIFFGSNRRGLIFSGVFGGPVLLVVLYGLVFVAYRTVRKWRNSDTMESCDA